MTVGITKVILCSMKTAISVPQDIFELSEKLAKKLKISRSAVFALGVKRLSEDEAVDEDELIARINAVCATTDTSLDPAVKRMQARTLQRNEW
ncbi:hypothetical protein BH24ACI3_BH24ACI3_14170 [soil metagenome]